MNILVRRVLTFFFFFQAEDGIRDGHVTGVRTCALPIFHYSQGMTGTITVGKGAPGGGGTATTTASTGTPVVSSPSAASNATPPKPGVYWLGYGLLGGGALLALAAVFGYLRFYPGFRRER